jgi:hypothetical protein
MLLLLQRNDRKDGKGTQNNPMRYSMDEINDGVGEL